MGGADTRVGAGLYLVDFKKYSAYTDGSMLE
jgi:hypothetical protein